MECKDCGLPGTGGGGYKATVDSTRGGAGSKLRSKALGAGNPFYHGGGLQRGKAVHRGGVSYAGKLGRLPAHKHDVDKMPGEGILEELYYFLFQPEQGFAIQELYTKDGEIDVTYTVKQDELVEFPRGVSYHSGGARISNLFFMCNGRRASGILPFQ